MTSAKLGTDGWNRANTWGQSQATLDLYRRRAGGDEPEMVCIAQAADLLADVADAGDSVLDIGCGTGHLRHALTARGMDIRYTGIDPTASFIETGLAASGETPPDLNVLRVEDLSGEADHVVAINVLSYLDNFHRPLERMLQTARKTVLIRESLGAESVYRYVPDQYLDPGPASRVYVNCYALNEVTDFVHGYDFSTTVIVDRFSGGEASDSIGYPHYWKFLLCRRRG